MWDDEDNNPYGSFQRRGSEGSDIQSPGERVSHIYHSSVEALA